MDDQKLQVYLNYKNKRKLEILGNLKRISLVLFISVASFFSVGGVSAAVSTKPAIGGFTASPTTLSYSGGSVALSANVKNATRCIFTVSPAVVAAANVACSKGKIAHAITLPRNNSTLSKVYAFKLTAVGKPGKGIAVSSLKKVTVAATTQPVIKSFTSSNTTLASAGGNITLTGLVANEVSCNVTSSPTIDGTSSNIVPCGSGSATIPVVMPANTSAANINYIFTLTVTGTTATTSKNLVVTVDSASTTPPPVTTTTTPVATGNTIPVPAQPDAMVLAGNDIWVASCKANAVTEINKNSKQIVQTITNTSGFSTYGFSCPDALAFDGSTIWVANKSGNSITMLSASDGSLVKIISGSRIYNPDALVVTNNGIWIADISTSPSQGDSICKFSLNGIDLDKVIQTPSSLKYGAAASDMVFDGTNIWTVDTGSEIYEFNANTGTYVRTLVAAINGTTNIYYYGGYIWANGSADSLVGQYNAITGATVRKIAVTGPNQLVYNGSHLFVVSDLSGVVVLREYSPAGTLVATIAKTNSADSRVMEVILLDGNRIWTMNYIASTVSVYNF